MKKSVSRFKDKIKNLFKIKQTVYGRGKKLIKLKKTKYQKVFYIRREKKELKITEFLETFGQFLKRKNKKKKERN